jgi:cobalamin biosynthesis protein CobD/CbiB
MKQKTINLLLILSSLLGYLEWGGGNHLFLLQAEGELLRKMFSDPTSVIHPFTIMPLAGQIILAITLFQKTPSKVLTFIGIGCIILLFLLMLFIGISIKNLKIFSSTIPFIFLSVLTILRYKKA